MGRLGMLRYHATPSTPSRSVWWAQAGRKQGASMAQLWALSCGLEWVAGVSHGGVGAARRVDRRRFSVRTPPPPPPGPLRYAPVPNPCFQLRCRVHHFVLLSGVVRCGLAKINGKIGKQRLSGLLGRKGAHYGRDGSCPRQTDTCRPGETVEDLQQGHSLDVLHRHVANAIVLPDEIDAGDVRMLESGEGLPGFYTEHSRIAGYVVSTDFANRRILTATLYGSSPETPDSLLTNLMPRQRHRAQRWLEPLRDGHGGGRIR